MRALLLALAALVLIGTPALAQGIVQQSGPIVPFHPTVWGSNGVVMDGGTNAAPAISTLGMFNGASCPFTISSQTGPAAPTAPYSQFSVCQSLTASTLTFLGLNGASPPNVYFNIGGVNYPFPGPGNGTVIGPPSSTTADAACFAGITGTILSDCGATVPLYSATTSVANTTFGTNYQLQPAGVAYPCANYAGIFPGGKVYSFLAACQNWTSGNTSGAGPGPIPTLFAFASTSVTGPDVLGGLIASHALVSNAKAIGANIIASSNGGGLTGVKLNPLELDAELTAGDSAASSSAGLIIAAFNGAIPAGIEFGTSSSGPNVGSWTNAIICAGFTADCLADQAGVSATTFINASNGTYTGGTLVTACGLGQGIALGPGGGGVSPFVYGDCSGNQLFQLGTGNLFGVKNSAGVTELSLAGSATTGGLTVSPTTASSSTTTGAIVDSGGLGVAGAAFFGGAVKTSATTASTTTSTGAVIDAGGLGVAGAAYIGGLTSTAAVILSGTAPTLTGTCTVNTQVGGNAAGSFHATCTSQTVIITFANTAPNGWVCNAQDETTSADSMKQTAHNNTSCTLTGTTAANDNIVFSAVAF